VFPTNQIEFHKYQIVRVHGIPNVDSRYGCVFSIAIYASLIVLLYDSKTSCYQYSDESEVWLLHWLSMEHFFNPESFYKTVCFLKPVFSFIWYVILFSKVLSFWNVVECERGAVEQCGGVIDW